MFLNFTFFKNALLRALSKFILAFKHNEIVIKIKKNTINFIRKKKKKKLIRNVNTCAKKNKIQNINIKTIIKLSSENVVIQTRNLKKTLKFKENSNWITNLYESKIIAIAKIYSILIHIYKINLFLFKKLTTFKIAIKQ